MTPSLSLKLDMMGDKDFNKQIIIHVLKLFF